MKTEDIYFVSPFILEEVNIKGGSEDESFETENGARETHRRY
jgi:hypothetical protein